MRRQRRLFIALLGVTLAFVLLRVIPAEATATLAKRVPLGLTVTPSPVRPSGIVTVAIRAAPHARVRLTFTVPLRVQKHRRPSSYINTRTGRVGANGRLLARLVIPSTARPKAKLRVTCVARLGKSSRTVTHTYSIGTPRHTHAAQRSPRYIPQRAVLGKTPRLRRASSSWPAFTLPGTSIRLRYPSGWSAAREGGPHVIIDPPGSKPNLPDPNIVIDFAPHTPYSHSDRSSNEGPSHRIVVDGVVGREFADKVYLIPTERDHVELPYRGGTLFFDADEGPITDLVDQLHEILRTVTFR